MTRTISAIIASTLFIFAIVRTESWLFIGIEVLGFELICYLIICADRATEYKEL